MMKVTLFLDILISLLLIYSGIDSIIELGFIDLQLGILKENLFLAGVGLASFGGKKL